MLGRNFPMAFTDRQEVGSAFFALVPFAADFGAREAPRAAETAIRGFYIHSRGNVAL